MQGPAPEGGVGAGLERLLQSLSSAAHVLPLRGDDMEVLESPDDFFQELLAGLRTAQRRVAMASLYLGTGEGREAEIAAALAAAAHDGCRPSLRIHLLLDALRCTRPTCGYGRASTSSSSSVDSSSSSSGGGASVESSSSGGGGGGDSSGGSGAAQPPPMTSTAEMLATQLLEGQAGEGRVAVSLFHTPALRGLLKRMLPPRVSEVLGVMHMKAYVFDDTVILSGANISSTYLSSRQDRYMVLRNSPQLAAFLESVVAAVGRFSCQLLPADAAAAAPAATEGGTRRGDALLQLLARQQQLLLGGAGGAAAAGAATPRRHHLQRHRSQRSQRYSLAPCPAGVDPVLQAPLFCSALRQHLLQLFAPPAAWHAILDFAALEAEAMEGTLAAAAAADAAAGAQGASQQQLAEELRQQSLGQAVAAAAPSGTPAGGTLVVPAGGTAGDQPDTWIVPLVQAGFAGVRQDERCTLRVLSWATQRQQQTQQQSGGSNGSVGGAGETGRAGGAAAPNSPCALLQLASPYLNLARPLEWFLARQAGAAELELVTSSPEANGFYGSTGLSGHIPLAYSLLEHRTWQRLNRRRSSWLPQAAREGRGGGTRALRALAARQQLWWARGGAVSLGDAAAAAAVAGAAAAAGDKPALVAAQASSAAAEAAGGSAALAAARRLYEYRRPGWEFHAKGLWVSQQQQRGVSQQQQPGQHGGGAHVPSWAAPAVTLIGSSNFGFRSLHRDLEVQFVVVTRNERLRQALGREVASLKQHCQAVEGEAHLTAARWRASPSACCAVSCEAGRRRQPSWQL